jgi:hypothetical protein
MILQPKTRYAHQFLEIYGNEWVLIRKSDGWYSATRPGPWGFIQQVDGLKTFFIHLHEDHHFLIQRK